MNRIHAPVHEVHGELNEIHVPLNPVHGIQGKLNDIHAPLNAIHFDNISTNYRDPLPSSNLSLLVYARTPAGDHSPVVWLRLICVIESYG
jgi:hypothetical protein